MQFSCQFGLVFDYKKHYKLEIVINFNSSITTSVVKHSVNHTSFMLLVCTCENLK